MNKENFFSQINQVLDLEQETNATHNDDFSECEINFKTHSNNLFKIVFEWKSADFCIVAMSHNNEEIKTIATNENYYTQDLHEYLKKEIS